MNIVFSQVFSSLFVKFLVFIVILKFLNVVSIYFLPHHGVYKVPAKSLDLPYFATRLGKLFEAKKEVKKSAVDTTKLQPITDLVLKAIYGNINNKQSSFIMVVEKNKKTTHLLSIGDEIKKYKFVDVNIKDKEAIFEANNKRYTLRIDTIKDKKPLNLYNIAPLATSKPKQSLNDVILAVPRGEILKYRKNFKDIWKNISIVEVVKKGKIDGFLVRYIKQGTIFSRLGLRAGDVIKSINNNPLRSYADAFSVYYKIEKAKALKVTIIRDNIQKELEYEIY